jgi:hypothetical protein
VQARGFSHKRDTSSASFFGHLVGATEILLSDRIAADRGRIADAEIPIPSACCRFGIAWACEVYGRDLISTFGGLHDPIFTTKCALAGASMLAMGFGLTFTQSASANITYLVDQTFSGGGSVTGEITTNGMLGTIPNFGLPQTNSFSHSTLQSLRAGKARL